MGRWVRVLVFLGEDQPLDGRVMDGLDRVQLGDPRGSDSLLLIGWLAHAQKSKFWTQNFDFFKFLQICVAILDHTIFQKAVVRCQSIGLNLGRLLATLRCFHV